jgi:TonB family protein
MKESIRIMKTKPQVSEVEIRSYMNFDDLLARRALAQKKGQARRKSIVIAACGLLLLSAIVFYFADEGNTTSDRQGDVVPALEPIPPLSPDDSADLELPSGEGTPLPERSVRQENPTDSKNQNAPKVDSQARSDQRVLSKEPVYVQAEPVAGYPGLYDYFEERLVYPPAAIKDSVEGVVNVVFEIDTTGRPAGIVVENSLGPAFDKEAIRLIENMPMWRAASYNGKPVKSKISLPITFGVTKVTNSD